MSFTVYSAESSTPVTITGSLFGAFFARHLRAGRFFCTPAAAAGTVTAAGAFVRFGMSGFSAANDANDRPAIVTEAIVFKFVFICFPFVFPGADTMSPSGE